MQVEWDEGRLLAIGGREFSYSGTHFNGDVTDVQVGWESKRSYSIHQPSILGQVFSRELDPQDALDYTTCKKVLMVKRQISIGQFQKLEGDVASWERLEGWESVGKVEQFTMRSVLITFEVDVFEVSASILKISTFIVHKGKTTSALVEDLVVENGC